MQLAESTITVHSVEASLRDLFAMHAPINMIDANESLYQTTKATRFARADEENVFPMPMIMRELIRLRYEYADAMLAAGATSG